LFDDFSRVFTQSGPVADVHIDSAGIKMAVLLTARLVRIGGTMIGRLMGVTVIVEVINNG
jgi:hypothetical protein